MAKFEIISGEFAEVFTGNGTYGWLVEGDDVQARANANIDPYWLTEGRDCPIMQRHVPGHALAVDGEVKVMYTSREAAERGLARQMAL